MAEFPNFTDPPNLADVTAPRSEIVATHTSFWNWIISFVPLLRNLNSWIVDNVALMLGYKNTTEENKNLTNEYLSDSLNAKNQAESARNEAIGARDDIMSYVISEGTAMAYDENIELVEANMSNILDIALQIEIFKKIKEQE